MPPPAADDAVLRFLDALAWNWLIAGTDAHAKNYSLLLAGRQVRLAPLYDVASSLPYGVHERKLRLAMKIGGDYRVHPIQSTWPKAAKELGLDPALAVDRVLALARRAPDAFSQSAGTPEVVELDSSLPARLADLVAERCERCIAILDSSAPKASDAAT
jgi:serine/threonine-protein kinase HipA